MAKVTGTQVWGNITIRFFDGFVPHKGCMFEMRVVDPEGKRTFATEIGTITDWDNGLRQAFYGTIKLRTLNKGFRTKKCFVNVRYKN